MEQKHYDAVVVLGATMKWNSVSSRWDFPAIIQEYAGKLVFGEERALAAKEINTQGLTSLLLITGGFDVHPDTKNRVSRSEKLRELITDGYGVPQEKAVAIGNLTGSHTQGNVQNIVNYLESHQEILKGRYIGILSPDFQKERAKLMFDANPYFENKNIRLDWLSVEKILSKGSPDYEEHFEQLYSTKEAEICKKLEEKGAKDFLSGAYKARRE